MIGVEFVMLHEHGYISSRIDCLQGLGSRQPGPSETLFQLVLTVLSSGLIR